MLRIDKLTTTWTLSSHENKDPGSFGPEPDTDFSQLNIKEEPDAEMEGHSHSFRVKFSPTNQQIFDIHCDRPRTLLQAVKSLDKYQEMRFTDGHVVIQLGEEDKEYVVATHFPCSCVSKDEIVILYHKEEEVEASQNQGDQLVHSRDKYSVFYIDSVGGINTKSKQLFKSPKLNKFKYLCVYGEKGITVEEALNRDGRFLNLGEFTLSKNRSPNHITERTQRVVHLHGERFKIRLPLDCNPKTKIKKEATAGLQSKTRKEATD